MNQFPGCRLGPINFCYLPGCRTPSRSPCHVASTLGFHAHRITRGHRDYRNTDWPAVARGTKSPRGGGAVEMHQQLEADRPRRPQLRGHNGLVAARRRTALSWQRPGHDVAVLRTGQQIRPGQLHRGLKLKSVERRPAFPGYPDFPLPVRSGKRPLHSCRQWRHRDRWPDQLPFEIWDPAAGFATRIQAPPDRSISIPR